MVRQRKALSAQGDIPSEASTQLRLFELMDPSESDYSNTVELYDALPKYVWSITEEEVRKNRVLTRSFKSRGVVYQVKIKPAVVERKKGGESESVMLYPGSREEMVEEVLRKLAVNGNLGLAADGNNHTIGVYFTVNQLRKELARTNHTYSASEVLEALDVMSSSLLEVSQGKGSDRDAYRGNFLSSLAVRRREAYLEDGTAKCFATFHPLVQHAIRTQQFRMYDYSTSMNIRSDLGRYFFKRMSHYWAQASLDNPYQFKLVPFLESSPRGLSPRMKDNMRAIRLALTALAEEDVILPNWNETMIKNPQDRRQTVDVAYEVFPTESFRKKVMRANKKQSVVTGRATLNEARSAIAHQPGSSNDGSSLDDGSDNVFDDLENAAAH